MVTDMVIMQCMETISTLETDALPNDPNEWKDTDGDGVGDNSDDFPTDGTQWVDSDGDWFGDNPLNRS